MYCLNNVKCNPGLLLLFSHPVMADSLWPHGLPHARPPCPSPSPGVCPNSHSLHRWCYPAISSSDALFFCTQSFPAYLTSMGDEYNCPKVTPSDLGTHLLVSYLFGLLYSSGGSHGKYTGVVCHSLLQWIMFCQNSPLWPVHLGWPYTPRLIGSLSYPSPFAMTRSWCVKGTYKVVSVLNSFAGLKANKMD